MYYLENDVVYLKNLKTFLNETNPTGYKVVSNKTLIANITYPLEKPILPLSVLWMPLILHSPISEHVQS